MNYNGGGPWNDAVASLKFEESRKLGSVLFALNGREVDPFPYGGDGALEALAISPSPRRSDELRRDVDRLREHISGGASGPAPDYLTAST
jgi:hypothetical protein